MRDSGLINSEEDEVRVEQYSVSGVAMYADSLGTFAGKFMELSAETMAEVVRKLHAIDTEAAARAAAAAAAAEAEAEAKAKSVEPPPSKRARRKKGDGPRLGLPKLLLFARANLGIYLTEIRDLPRPVHEKTARRVAQWTPSPRITKL